MLSIDINELVDYTICSYKHALPRKKRQLDSYLSIRSKLYSNLFDYCLYLKSVGTTISLEKLNKQLNYCWNDMKKSVQYALSISEMISIKHKLFKFLELFGTIDNVIYYAIPIEVTTEEISIFFDLYSYYQEGKLKSVVKIQVTQLSLVEDSFCIQLAGNVVLKGIKKLEDSLKHNVYIFKTDSVNLYSYNKNSNLEKLDILNKISKGIYNKIYIPKNDFVICHNCVHKLECSWSLSNK